MSHQALAAVWAQLEVRTDIDNIFCEVIGRNSLESSVLLTDSAELLSSSFELVVFFKVIFDLQRTYSQGLRSSSACPHLLRPQQLLFGIIYLLRLKRRIFHRSGDTSDQYVAKRSFIIQTVVSGLRALWLRRYPLTPEKIDQLRSSFHEAWSRDELIGIDSFLIHTLCQVMLENIYELSNPPLALSYPACKAVTLRDYSSGLYPLESRLDELVTPVNNAASSLSGSSSNWLRSYWTIFDIFWTTEAAMIQLCIHASRPIGSAISAPPTEDDINQLSITRRRVLDAIFGSRTIKEVIKLSMALILLSPCTSEDCSCVGRVGAQSDHLNAISAGSSFIEPYKKVNAIPSQFLDTTLERLTKVLEYRKENLRDCNGDLSNISESLDNYMATWFSEVSSIRFSNGNYDAIQRTAYIVDCPALHAVPYDVLKGLIEHSAGKVGLTDLEKNPPHFRIDSSCSQCRAPYPISFARQIEPLGRLAATIKERLYRKPSPELESRDWSFDVYHQPRFTSSDSTMLSSGSSRSNSISLNEKNPPKKGSLTDFFDESSQRSNGLRVAPSYCFSADGQSLLLWMRYGSQVVVYDIKSGEKKRFPANDINFVAAGVRYYAVISSIGNGQNLNVYARNDGTLVGTNIRPIVAPVFSVAISRNDKFVALGFAGEVWIYVVETSEITHHKLPCAEKPQHQLAAFSADSEKIIVATRYSKGNVCTYVSECLNPEASRHLPSIRIPTGIGNDFGLSSVLYDNNSNHAFLTSYTRKTAPVIFPPQSYGVPQYLGSSYNRHLGTQIQCAAHCPSGVKLALVNDRNEVYTVRKKPDAHWHVEKMKVNLGRTPIVSREDMMAMVMPNEDTIHLFWIKGVEWTLMTI